MRRGFWWISLFLTSVVGCGESGVPTPGNEPGTATTVLSEPSSDTTLTQEQIAVIQELPEADAKLALEQKVCVVSGEPLGSMGKPVKVVAQGQTAFLCCEGCRADFDADPAKYLARRKTGN